MGGRAATKKSGSLPGPPSKPLLTGVRSYEKRTRIHIGERPANATENGGGRPWARRDGGAWRRIALKRARARSGESVREAIRWLRIAYWVGAVVDLAAGAQMLRPPLFAFGAGAAGFAPGADYRYAMDMGASLMFGWTALLVWADRKPVERMGRRR